MTPAMAAYLRKLRDEGPQPPCIGNEACYAEFAEWLANRCDADEITPAGLEELAKWEAENGENGA